MVAKKQKYQHVDQEKYKKIMEKYEIFYEAMGDENKEPVSPFEPLAQKMVDELELIREISKQLQKKKEDDINKAAQAAKEAEEEAANKKPEVEQQEQEDK